EEVVVHVPARDPGVLEGPVKELEETLLVRVDPHVPDDPEEAYQPVLPRLELDLHVQEVKAPEPLEERDITFLGLRERLLALQRQRGLEELPLPVERQAFGDRSREEGRKELEFGSPSPEPVHAVRVVDAVPILFMDEEVDELGYGLGGVPLRVGRDIVELERLLGERV